MICERNCRYCQWSSFFLGETNAAPFQLSLQDATSATRSVSVAASRPMDATSSPVPTSKPQKRSRGKTALWVDSEVSRRAAASDMETCKTHGLYLIRWEAFATEWSLDGIVRTVSLILRGWNDGYIGVSEKASWRWKFCENHGSMQPHGERFDEMHPLCYEHGEAMPFLEERCIELVRTQTGCKLQNSLTYRPGPLRKERNYFLYLCVSSKV